MNILSKEPLTQDEIDTHIALSQLHTGLEYLGCAGLISGAAALIFGAQTRGMDSLFSRNHEYLTDLLFAIGIGSLAVIVLAGSLWYLFGLMIKYDKESLQPIKGDQIAKMLAHCEQYPEIDAYRRKVVKEGRQLYCFELDAATQFGKYLKHENASAAKNRQIELSREKLYS
jgi:hypothetical protein